jgi:hypothetical protein
MFQPLVRRLRMRYKTLEWASGGLAGTAVWRHAWSDGAHCRCAARRAAERLNDNICARSARILNYAPTGNFGGGGATRRSTHPDRQICRLAKGTNYAESPCGVAAFVVNQEPHTGARPSASLGHIPWLVCVWSK